MRLNNHALLQRLMSMGLSAPNFSAVKRYMCLGERLKNTEHSLLYLKRCKSHRIFPVFIMNNFQFHSSIFQQAFFPLSLERSGRTKKKAIMRKLTFPLF